MKTIIIRQRKSLYNRQNLINCLAKFMDKSSFIIKQKGKHDYTIMFRKPVSDSIVPKINAILGLDVVYQSDVKCILTDFVNY